MLYGEIDDASRRDLEGHLEGCPGCRAALAGERRLLALLAGGPPVEPSGGLLLRCRDDLARALRDEPAAGAAPARWWHVLRPPFRPSLVYALAVLAVGFFAGWLASAWDGGGVSRPPGTAGAGAAGEGASADPEAVIAGMRSLQVDGESGQVVLGYDTRHSASLQGPISDPRIRALLVETVRRSANAGLRLVAIDALRPEVNDADVRAALLHAMQEDANPGVRLKALAALDSRTTADTQVREAFVDALQRDTNPGVRVGAIDALTRAGDARTLPVMERLARQGADPYVRLRSSAFVEAMYAREQR